MAEQPLLIALVAVQFLVHALGWGMTAHLTQRWRTAEGHFAIHWLLLAAGLLLYVPPWPSGSLPRNAGDLLIVASAAAQYRGMALYWEQRTQAWRYVALLGATATAVAASFLMANGHGLRVAAVCVGVGLMLLATVRLVWRQGRPAAPWFSAVVAGGYALLALLLLARAVQALRVGASTKISIDAPGHTNVPFAIVVMFVGGLINLAQIRLVLGRVLQHLRSQAQTDVLTGAVNRRGMLQRLDAAQRRLREGGPGYALLMIDVDHFKSINDRLGHAEGDNVLKRVAQALRAGLHDEGVVARWGGEEFCVLLPALPLAAAAARAEALRAQVAASGEPQVTISIGAAEACADAPIEALDAVIRRADAALYRAKQAGRNRVVSAPA